MSELFKTGRNRLSKRKAALETMKTFFSSRELILAVHYSCESFYDNASSSNRITSIAIRFLSSGQTRSFSIHQIAEENGIKAEEINKSYDSIERKLLDAYFSFVKSHLEYKWVHWNMRDINFGFYAIEHRYRVLGGVPEIIHDSKKFDLSRLLVELYGDTYIKHPRLKNILELNNCKGKEFLSGEEESQAFKNGEYSKLHQSTLRKCDSFETLLDLANSDELKTENSWFSRYGLSPEIIGAFLKDHWIIYILSFIFSVYGFISAFLAILG